MRNKINEVNKHNSPDVFCLAETFLKKTYNKPRDVHIDYKWVGKHRPKERKNVGQGCALILD